MSFYFQPPDLAEFPRRSYRRFLEETLGNLFTEISPILSEFNPRFELSFVGQDGKVHWRFEDYAYDSGYPTSSEHARKTNMTHSRRLQMDVWLRDLQTNELRRSVAYMGDVPVITDRGTFVINGSERVVLGQLVRAPGVYYQMNSSLLYKGLILAELGAPVSIELDLERGTGKHSRAKCRIKLPKRGWVSATTVLTAMGVEPTDLEKRLGKLLERNGIEWKHVTQNEALSVVGRSWKPDGGGGVSSGHTALLELTDKRRYSMGSLGRRRFNEKLHLEEQSLQMKADDLLAAVEYILGLPLSIGHTDNIDSLENRHLRGIGDVLMRAVRPALAQMSRSIRTRLELHEEDEIGSPNDFVDTRPFTNAINKFFSGNPLVQYLDQQNPLSELSHRRRITSFDPGGIDPNAAPTEMRDVHPSQIGRVCLVESPEGKNCGMVAYLATYCRIDDDGFMTVPYRKVIEGQITDEVKYLTPADDKRYTLAPPDSHVENGKLVGMVHARRGENFFSVTPEEVDMVGIAPQGFISVGSGLIPFLEHDDANRALMGGGMMRQTLPLVKPERPRVGTGMEKIVARSSGHSVTARRAGTVTKVSATEIKVTQSSGELRSYPLIRFDRTNQNTILDQRPIVKEGERIEAGQIIADGPGIDQGELALGRNLLIAFIPWNGYNFEDAIVLRQGLIRDQKLSHIEIEKHSVGVHQTLRGPEILTPELPNIALKDLEHLDERGIAKIGSYVEPGDILVSKLSPKEARALSAEEELLQAIFGKVAEEMADTSLRVPHGSGGRVIDIRIFTPETTPELKAGIICEIEVLIARMCPVEVGDKLAGRHGNKGIVSIIVPDEDMPYLPDGTPVDICLNPLGVPSRMNVGQVFDTQLGLYSQILNRYYRIHQFDESLTPDASYRLVNEALAEVRKQPGYEWMGEDGKVKLTDGRTGLPFDRPVLVGRQYMLKLNQLVLHKINARSGLGGPYAAVTQQPVGGKANHGGQRMGEMEVWAIQAYGCAHLLNEMMTIKADDIQGRHQAYSDMVQGKDVTPGGRTAAFDGLCCELRGLGLEVTLGRIIDVEEPLKDKQCSVQQQQLSLEEEYQVSQVSQFEEDGQKILEIPAGDYEPIVRPQPVPMIPSLMNSRAASKQRFDMSQEPLIDEFDDDSEDALVNSFISSQVADLLLLESHHGPDGDPLAVPPTDSFAVPPADSLAVPHADSLAVPHADSLAVPHTDSLAVPHTDSLAVPHTDSFAVPNADSRAVPHADSRAVPHTDSLAVPHADSPAVPHTDSLAVPHTDSLAVPHTDSLAVPDADSLAVPDADSLAVPHTDSLAVPHADSPAVPHTDSRAVPDADTLAVPHADSLAVPHADSLTVPPAQVISALQSGLPQATTAAPPGIPHVESAAVPHALGETGLSAQPNRLDNNSTEGNGRSTGAFYQDLPDHDLANARQISEPLQPASPDIQTSLTPSKDSMTQTPDMTQSQTADLAGEPAVAPVLEPVAVGASRPAAEEGGQTQTQDAGMVDFPSMSELTSLSHQLARLRNRQREMEDDLDDEVKLTD